MKHFVYYDDDYTDNGGVGFKEFDTEEQAVAFIERRISEEPTSRSINNYVLICGTAKDMEVVEIVKRIKVI